jgi:SAM-dependent methyltransferase
MKACPNCATTFDGLWFCPRCNFAPKTIEGFLSFAPDLASETSQLHPTDFATLAAIENQNFWFRSRNRLIGWAIQRYFERPAKILEIGCGTGFVLSEIRRIFPVTELSGSEASCAGLAFAAQRVKSASLFQMDARNIPFREEFDVVGAFDVLEHIREDERVLSQMHAALRPGGGIVVTVPQHAFLWSPVDEVAGHVRRYSARELIEKVSRAGFHVTRATSFVSLLLPLMIASRLGRRNSSGKAVAESEFVLGPVGDFLLERLFDVERGLIRMGLSFPVGGSMLIVARKH